MPRSDPQRPLPAEVEARLSELRELVGVDLHLDSMSNIVGLALKPSLEQQQQPRMLEANGRQLLENKHRAPVVFTVLKPHAATVPGNEAPRPRSACVERHGSAANECEAPLGEHIDEWFLDALT